MMPPRSPAPSSSSKMVISKILLVLMLLAAIVVPVSGDERSRADAESRKDGAKRPPLPPKGKRPANWRRGDGGTIKDVRRNLEYDQSCVQSCTDSLSYCADACTACGDYDLCGCADCEPAYNDCKDGCEIEVTPSPTYSPTMAPNDDGTTSTNNDDTTADDDDIVADDDTAAADDDTASNASDSAAFSGASQREMASGLVGIGLAGTLLAFA